MVLRHNKGKDIRDDARDMDYQPRSLVDNLSSHPTNGEEHDSQTGRVVAGGGKYRNFVANYTKGMHHSPKNDPNAGEVFVADYQALLHAINSGDPQDFEAIPRGCENGDPCCRRYTNPQAGLAFDLEGPDSHSLILTPPPRIDHAQAAAEMAELYWMALNRDVNFDVFINAASNGLIDEAVADLNTNYSYKIGPIDPLTVNSIFRGFTSGDLKGPYVSQFLLRGNNDPSAGISETDGLIIYGTLRIDQRQKTVVANRNYMKHYEDNADLGNNWLAIQNGQEPRGMPDPQDHTMCKYSDSCGMEFVQLDNCKRGLFIRNLRDLANYVHFDDLPQEFINACLILKHLGVPSNHGPPCAPGPHGPACPCNPYLKSSNQEGFVTFGDVYTLTLVTEVARRAAEAAWFQKWFVHRWLRPEEFGGLIHRQLNANSPDPDPNLQPPNPPYSINSEILRIGGIGGNPTVLDRIFQLNNQNTYLLPQAYIEGSPLHPSYPSGHATIAGACVTILKAFYDESFTFKKAYQSDSTGMNLIPAIDFNGNPIPDNVLTVGDELNKLASNIAIGRNAAGVHYRSDYKGGLRLGEKVAISILRDQLNLYNEPYCFKFHKFNGDLVKIGNDCKHCS